MTWLTYIFPRIILKTSSPYNRDIRVLEEVGRYKLLVNGSRQSGSYIAMLWRKTFQKFDIAGLPVSRILVLGVGGGSVFGLLQRLFPHAAVTGVDIDPMILAIARKYFKFSHMPHVRLVQADAQKFVQRKKRHDLIIVDLFIGSHIPSFVTSDGFLIDLKRLLARDGRIVFNYLRELEYQKKSEQFFVKLRKIFAQVDEFRIERNRFFFASLQPKKV